MSDTTTPPAAPQPSIPAATSDSTLTAAELFQLAVPVLCAADSLKLVYEAIEKVVAGNSNPAKLVYLSATTRLLPFSQGKLLAHLEVLGPSSSGKSYQTDCALGLLPADAVVRYDAGSARSMIYDNRPTKHRVIYFRELDSIPQGDDSPAASAVRTLQSEGRIVYSVVERKPGTQAYYTRHISKEGPSVMITTGVKELPEQLGTRTFTVEVDDSKEQIRAGLRMQSRLEMGEKIEPPQNLLAYQAYLQTKAVEEDGIDVFVPFSGALVRCLEKQPLHTRVYRDFARILSLTKAVAILRIGNRKTNGAGQVIAELDDYAAVRDILYESYLTTASISDECRKTIEAACGLLTMYSQVTLGEIRQVLKSPPCDKTIRRHLQTAVDRFHLSDKRDKRLGPTAPWVVGPGDTPMDGASSLPTVAAVRAEMGPNPTDPTLGNLDTARTQGVVQAESIINHKIEDTRTLGQVEEGDRESVRPDDGSLPPSLSPRGYGVQAPSRVDQTTDSKSQSTWTPPLSKGLSKGVQASKHLRIIPFNPFDPINFDSTPTWYEPEADDLPGPDDPEARLLAEQEELEDRIQAEYDSDEEPDGPCMDDELDEPQEGEEMTQ